MIRTRTLRPADPPQIRTGDLAFYRTYSPNAVSLPTLVRVAGRRWAIEESFQAGKGLAGVDEHQVRRWTSWHRATILSMLAHAFLAVTAATERAHTRTPDAGLIPLTANEIRHLFTALLRRTVHEIRHLLHWSQWRRQHQARAQAAHYRRQACGCRELCQHPDLACCSCEAGRPCG